MTDSAEPPTEPPKEPGNDGGRREAILHLEDRGDRLFVRVKRSTGGSVPVTISREALEDRFGAGPGSNDLVQAYIAHQEIINAKVAELDPAGNLYTDSFPMLLGAVDFD